jgi:hypothetical protein
MESENTLDAAKEKRNDRFKMFLWIGFVPLLIVYLVGHGWLPILQTFLATFYCYGYNFYVQQGEHLSELWLWRGILATALLHLLLLIGIVWSDKTFPNAASKPIVFIPALVVGLALESALIDRIIESVQAKSDLTTN